MRKLPVALVALAAVALCIVAVASAAPTTSVDVTLTPTSGPPGTNVNWVGTVYENGAPLSGASVYVQVFQHAGCTQPNSYAVHETSDSSGDFGSAANNDGFTIGSSQAPGDQMSVQASVGGTGSPLPYAASVCQNFTVTAAGSGSGSGALPYVAPPSSGYLCYAVGGTPYAVQAGASLLGLAAGGYWLPEAAAGNVSGGENIGAYHLVCGAPIVGQTTGPFINGGQKYADNNGNSLAYANAADTGWSGVYLLGTPPAQG